MTVNKTTCLMVLALGAFCPRDGVCAAFAASAEAIRIVDIEKAGEGGLKLPKGRDARLELPFEVGKPGKYVFWIKHWQDEGKRTALEFLLRSPTTECVNYTLIDRFEDMWTDSHAEGRVFGAEGRKAGWVWTRHEVEIEFAGRYVLNLAKNTRYVQRDLNAPTSAFAIADAWVSDDPSVDPAKGEPRFVQKLGGSDAAPAGFVKVTHHDPHARLNSSIEDPQKRAPTCLMECYSWFFDPVRYLKYGVVDGLWFTNETTATGMQLGCFDTAAGPYGTSFTANADAARRVNDVLCKKYPFDPKKEVSPTNRPIGRAAWSDGKYSGDFSFAFKEFNELYFEENKKDAQRILDEHPYESSIWAWWTAWEQCGNYDYGETSVIAWRKYLEEKYGSLAVLNAAWHTEYKSFDEITPAYWKNIFGNDKSLWFKGLERRQAMANFADFRAFCSKCYAERIAQKTRAYLAVDGKKRHVSSNLSCNNISSVLWMQWRPLIFEDTCQITQKGSDMVGYDNYGTDDLYGANYELFDAFGDGKLRPMVREGAIHAASAELQARSQWHNVAKGMQGQACFCVQEANVGELSKFGMTDMFHGATPRPKIAAFADNFRAIHQLEYIISEAKRERAVKPVAIYYSAVCHLFNEKPYLSMFDTGADNFFRVYELLHAKGYDVTFVTDRQIRENGDWIKSLGAIVFVDAKYIPLDVMEKLERWVGDGGSILADAQSGSCDDHTFPTDRFTKFLGIRPVQRKKADDMAAEKLSFGYSAYSYDVVNSDDLWNTCWEIKDAPGGTHPISRMLDKTMVSTFGCNEIKCIRGTQVLQNNNGGACMVVRNEGKGTVAYFAGFLGQMFGAGLTTYEHTDQHGDDSPYRVMDAWATWAGLEKVEVNDLPDNLSLGVRFESPLVDARGNAMLGIVSQLRSSVPSFRVKYRMPKGFKEPKIVLGAVNASRKLVKLPFAWDAKTRELSVRMCGFRCWGNILALNEIGPFVSVEAANAKRDAYSLAWFKPNDEVSYRVKVFNPSASDLKDGEVELRLSDGWFCDREKASVAKIAAYGESDEFIFRVKAPAYNSCRKLEPVNFIYRGTAKGGLLSFDKPAASSPAVEMVWFQKEPQNAAPHAFGVE